MQTILKVSQLHPDMQLFLLKTQECRKLKAEIKALSLKITPLFDQFVRKRFKFETDVEVCDAYGSCAALKLDYAMNTPYFGKKQVYCLLRDFFEIRFPKHEACEITCIAEDATKYMWTHRKAADKKTPRVKIVASKDTNKQPHKKPKLEDDEFEEDAVPVTEKAEELEEEEEEEEEDGTEDDED